MVFLLGIYIGLIFIRPMEWWEPVRDWQLVTFFAYGTILASFPRIIGEHQRLWRLLPEMRMAFLFLFTATASWAIYPFWPGGMSWTFQTFGKVIILYFLVVLLGRQPRNFKLLVWTVLLCVLWMAIHGILQHHRGYGFGGKEPRWRPDNAGSGVYQINAYGLFDDPNDLCLVFIVTVPILWSIYRAERNGALRLLALAIIPPSIYAAWLTNSRGGIVGIMGMMVAYAVARTKGGRRWFIAVTSIVLVTIVAPSRFGKGMGGGGRLIPWGDGIQAFLTHPVFGVGWGDFGSYSSEGKVAHNAYIHVLTECGVLGYVPFILILYFTMLHLRRAINQGDLISKPDRIYLSGLFSGMVGYLVAVYFLSRAYNHVLYVMLGLCACATLMVCDSPEMIRRVYTDPYKADLKRGLKLAFGSIPFLYFSVKIGYLLGVG